MALKDVISKAQELTGAAAEAAGKILEEFNEALPTLHALGFHMEDLRIEMGLTPQIGARLIASAENIEVSVVRELIAKHPDKKVLIGALKALEAAYHIRQQIPDLPCKGVALDVKLGVPPHVAVAFLSSAPAGVAAAAS